MTGAATTTPEGITHCIRRLGDCPDLAALKRVWSGFAYAYQRDPKVQEAKDSMKMALSGTQLPINYETSDWRQRKKARLAYIERQGGICCHCKAPLSGDPREKEQQAKINWKLFPPNFLSHPVHLHHNHKTGMTIGAAHARCNAYLWQYEGE